MDFLKKNYEKVLLGVVLVGLAVGAALLPWMIRSDREAEREKADKIRIPRVLPLADLDLSQITNLIRRAAAPFQLDFSTGHRLFNPVPWQKMPDGTLKKVALGGSVGLTAVVVTEIRPLYTTFSLEAVLPSASETRYLIGIERQAAPRRTDQRKKTTGAALNEVKSKEGFVITEVKGPPEAPTALTLNLTDTDEFATLSRDQPFRRVDGYEADLKYPSKIRPWNDKRRGELISGIGDDDYYIVAVTATNVVLSARSNNKKTSIPLSSGP